MLREEYDVIYGVPNNKSIRTFEKLGYKKKQDLDILIKPAINLRTVKESISRILRIKTDYNNSDRMINRLYKSCKKYGVKIAENFCFEQFNIDNIDGIQINRNETFYQWEIDNNNSKGFRYLYVEEDCDIKAICVVSLREGGWISGVDIKDIITNPGEEKAIRKIFKALNKSFTIIRVLSVN